MFPAILAIAGTMTVVVGLGISGAAMAEHHNPDQHFSFDCSSCKKDTTVDKGKTNLYVTCYGKQANPDHSGFYAVCSSPEVGVTCSFDWGSSACHCGNDTPKAHTVHINMEKCSQ